jgi:glycine oxidase
MGERACDVLVVGGGVMGCACAWRLAKAGLRVRVLERSVPGAEASSAAAGILGAQAEAHAPGPMLGLSLLSRARYPRWAAELYHEAGLDIGYRECGLLKVALDRRGMQTLEREARWQKRQRLKLEILSARRVCSLESALGAKLVGGVRYPDDARLDPPVLLSALHIAAARAGAEFTTGAYVRRVLIRAGRARGIQLDNGNELLAERVVVAAGSWTTLVDGLGLPSGAVRPARGQIVVVATPTPLLSSVVFGPRCYLVPRDDGRTLIGSTLEFVGYRREVTAGAVRDLLDAAIELVPALKTAVLRDTWSNFRPYTDDELPLIGSTSVEGLMLAAGHYRNGILLAPITAEIIVALARGRRPPLPIEPFSPRRAGIGTD